MANSEPESPENPCVGGSIPSLATILLPVLILAVTLVVLWPARGLYFASDDFHWLKAAQQAAEQGGWRRPADVNGHFRPLVEWSWLALWSLFGLEPSGYHAVVLLVHGLVAALVGAVALRLTGSRAAGLAGGLLFAVCFAHRSVPLWISALPDLLLGGFSALGLWLALDPRAGLRRLTPLPLLAALLVKETAFLLPAALLLAVPAALRSPRIRIMLGAGLGLALLPHGLATRGSDYLRGRFALGEHVGAGLLEALGSLLLPVGGASRPAGWATALGLGGLLAGIALAARQLGRKRALGWAGGVLLLVLPGTLSTAGIEPRWLYAPWVLLAPLLGAALLALGRLAGPRRGPALLAALVLVWVLAQGIALRGKIAGQKAREVWVRGLVEAARRPPAGLSDGQRVEVIVPFGAELRFWPLGVEVASGRRIEVRPIDDRTAPTPGVVLLDAAVQPPRWR